MNLRKRISNFLFGRSLAPDFVTVEEIPPDIDRKYKRTSPTSFACRACSANILSVTVQRPSFGRLHLPSGLGLDDFEPTVVPYCPSCEAAPVDQGPKT